MSPSDATTDGAALPSRFARRGALRPLDHPARRVGMLRASPTMTKRTRGKWIWLALLGVPFVGTLWVPFYNAIEPRILGVPYFYWYQFAWIGIGAGITALVYFATRDEGRGPDA